MICGLWWPPPWRLHRSLPNQPRQPRTGPCHRAHRRRRLRQRRKGPRDNEIAREAAHEAIYEFVGATLRFVTHRWGRRPGMGGSPAQRTNRHRSSTTPPLCLPAMPTGLGQFDTALTVFEPLTAAARVPETVAAEPGSSLDGTRADRQPIDHGSDTAATASGPLETNGHRPLIVNQDFRRCSLFVVRRPRLEGASVVSGQRCLLQGTHPVVEFLE
jgi:hypothetical protein